VYATANFGIVTYDLGLHKTAYSDSQWAIALQLWTIMHHTVHIDVNTVGVINNAQRFNILHGAITLIYSWYE